MGVKVCRECGEQLAEGVRYNTLYCPACIRKHHIEAMRKYREKNGARLREEDKQEYQYYKEHGICVDCHQSAADEGYTTCTACRKKRNIRSEKYLKRKA